MFKLIAARVAIYLAGVIALCLGVAMVALAQSSDISQDKLNLIQQRCTSSQLALQQIEKRDAVSRINRGRAYDQLFRQVSAFNSRLAYNKISAPDLIDLTNHLQNAVNKFRDDFDQYDTDLSRAQQIDCRTKPADYYSQIIKARSDRIVVNDQIKVVSSIMAQYREAVIKLEGVIK